MSRLHAAITIAMMLVSTSARGGPCEGGGSVPDPSWSTVPGWVFVVGRVSGGAAVDAFRPATIVIRNCINEPVPGATVTLDFSGCCDIALCEAQANGAPAAIADGVVTGVTDANGRVDFIVMGAARDAGTRVPPDQVGGCGASGVRVRAEGVVPGGSVIIGLATGVCLDQNGAAGGSNGTTTSDVANVLNQFAAFALGGAYKGRADLNTDGAVSIGDVGQALLHVGRLVLSGGVGCTAPFATSPPACP